MKNRALVLFVLILALMIPVSAAAQEDPRPLLMPRTLISAELADVSMEEELILFYANAGQEDLDYYLALCTPFGVFKRPAEGSTSEYYLFAPGGGVVGAAYYLEEERILAVIAGNIDRVYEDEKISAMVNILEKMEIRLPDNAAGNVGVQFYAVAGREPVQQGTTAVQTLFDNQMAWTEIYDEIEAQKLSVYAMYMQALGYDVQTTDYLSAPEEDMEIIRLLLSNGEAEIVLDYNAVNDTATVRYKPGISYYLLNGAEMNEALKGWYEAVEGQ